MLTILSTFQRKTSRNKLSIDHPWLRNTKDLIPLHILIPMINHSLKDVKVLMWPKDQWNLTVIAELTPRIRVLVSS